MSENAVSAAAAHWWANAIIDNVSQDNGAISEALEEGNTDHLMASIQAQVAGDLSRQHARSDLTTEHLNRFTQVLMARIFRHLRSNGEMFLTSDYGPELDLAECAVEAGWPDFCIASLFPWKTKMCVLRDGFSVKRGYSAEWETFDEIEETAPLAGASEAAEDRGEIESG